MFKCIFRAGVVVLNRPVRGYMFFAQHLYQFANRLLACFEEKTTITDQWSIFVNYAKGFLAINIIGSFPVDLIMMPYCSETPDSNTNRNINSTGNTLLQAPKIIKQLRLLRTLRLLRVSLFLRMIDRKRNQLRISPGYVWLFQLSLVIFIVLHYDACIMYWIRATFLDELVQDGSKSVWMLDT